MGEVMRSSEPKVKAAEAGSRAAQYFLDMGTCFFCAVDYAEGQELHQDHCTFHGMTREQVQAVADVMPEGQPPVRSG